MVKIRLARRGRKKLALFDLVVANVTAPRDGRFIEKIGTYNPNTVPATIVLDDVKALDWLMKGAQPTDTTRAILSYRGVMYKKHLQVGVNKGAITQEEADKKFDAWKSGKESKISGRVDSLAQAKVDASKARLEAETKVNTARATAQQAKLAAELKSAEDAAAPKVVAEEVVADAPAVEAIVAETTSAEVVEAPSAEAVVAETPAVEVAEAPVAEAIVEEPKAEETPAAEVAAASAPEEEAKKETEG